MSEISVRNMGRILDKLDRCPKGFTFDIFGKIEADGVIRLDIVDEQSEDYIGSYTKPSDYDWSKRAEDEFMKWFSARLHAKYDVEVIQ